jgi:hypothetical protein
MEWDGKERRKMDSDLRDVIIETRNDVRHIADWAKKHDGDDVKRFDLVNKEIEGGKKVLWGGIGILAFIEFFSRFLK